MIRYRCPHCAALIVAHERRAGQSSVCKSCVKPHPIPADRALWLNERGDPLHPPAAPAPVEPPAPEPIPLFEPISVSAPTASAEPPPAPEPAPTVSAEPPVVETAPPVAPAPEPEPVAPAVVALEARAASVPDIQLPEPPAEPTRVEPPAPVPEPVVTVRAPELEPDPEPTSAPEQTPAPNFGRSGSVALPPLRAPVVAAAEHAEDSVSQEESAVGTLTPPPMPAHEPPAGRPLPLSAAPGSLGSGRFTPAPAGTVDTSYAEPVQLQTQADIAVALTAALTSRMKPPATPRRDLRPSTAGWMLLTAIGVVLAVLALFSDPAYRWAALVVGVVQIAIGYVWIVRLTKFRDPTRGTLCMIPPITVVYLVQYKYAKCRPLRFVATGAALVGLALATPALTAHTRALVGRDAAPTVQPDPATLSKLEQLRTYRDQRSYDALSKHLELLAKTDPQLSVDAKDRAALSAELKALCDHPDTGVKVQAMTAYATWDPAGAQEVCLAALESPSWDVRERALRLVPQWRDAKTARAVQRLIGRAGTVETNRAKAALEEIGGVPAEQAAIALLNRAEDQSTKLTALAVLEKVGSVETAAWLRSVYAAAVSDTAVRDRALAASEAITARLRITAPAPPP
jgi:hypothetical protein